MGLQRECSGGGCTTAFPALFPPVQLLSLQGVIAGAKGPSIPGGAGGPRSLRWSGDAVISCAAATWVSEDPAVVGEGSGRWGGTWCQRTKIFSVSCEAAGWLGGRCLATSGRFLLSFYSVNSSVFQVETSSTQSSQRYLLSST